LALCAILMIPAAPALATVACGTATFEAWLADFRNDAVAKGNKADANSSYRAAVPVIDTLVNKHIIHRNQADRHKSRLAARVKSVST